MFRVEWRVIVIEINRYIDKSSELYFPRSQTDRPKIFSDQEFMLRRVIWVIFDRVTEYPWSINVLSVWCWIHRSLISDRCLTLIHRSRCWGFHDLWNSRDFEIKRQRFLIFEFGVFRVTCVATFLIGIFNTMVKVSDTEFSTKQAHRKLTYTVGSLFN